MKSNDKAINEMAWKLMETLPIYSIEYARAEMIYIRTADESAVGDRPIKIDITYK